MKTEESSTIAKLSSKSKEHYTPKFLVDKARKVLSTIDLDPATSKRVNSLYIKATNFYTKEDDALTKEWKENVFLNPPGGRILDGVSRPKSSAKEFYTKLLKEFRNGNVRSAILVVYSLDQLAQNQELLNYTFCILKQRLRFLYETSYGNFEEGSSQSHSNAIVLLTRDERVKNKFIEEFSELGKVLNG